MDSDCANYLDALKKCVLFDGIEDDDIKQILHCLNCRIMHYKKADYITHLYQQLDGAGIILLGEAAFVKENIKGNRIIAFPFHTGDMFGELLMLSQERQWTMTIQALTDCSVLFVNPEKILDVCENVCSRHKVLLTNLVRAVSKKAYDLSRKVEYLSLKSINGKLSKYLLDQSARSGKLTFKLPLNREKLADFLNISRPSMSRELGVMRDRGIIDFHGDLIRIKNEEKLRELLED